MAIAYNRLKRHLGVEEGPRFSTTWCCSARNPKTGIWTASTWTPLTSAAHLTPEPLQPWTCRTAHPPWRPAGSSRAQENGLAVRHASGTSSDGCLRFAVHRSGVLAAVRSRWPGQLRTAGRKDEQVTWEAIPTSPFDQPLTDARLDEIGRVARHRVDTEYAVSLAVGCNLLEWCQYLFGLENTYLYIGAEKTRLARFLDRLVELHLEFLARLLPESEAPSISWPWATIWVRRRGPQMSPAHVPELFFRGTSASTVYPRP